MKTLKFRSAPLSLAIIIATTFLGALTSNAYPLLGTTPLLDGTTVIPGLVPSGTPPGTLLASLTEPYMFTTTAGTTSGVVTTAVFREASGTLDFYYQASNNANSASSLGRVSMTDFASFLTNVGFRLDGSTVFDALFVDGTNPPLTADRDAGVIGFNFTPPVTDKIHPGQTSNVLVISTNATNFTAGNVELLDGGSVTLAAFQPAPSPAPDNGASAALLGLGLAGLFIFQRARPRVAKG